MTLAERVREIIGEELGIEKEEVKNSSTLDELGIDELDRIEIVMHLEEEYSIDISDEAMFNFETVQDIIDHVIDNT